jgi:hypothetical protein
MSSSEKHTPGVPLRNFLCRVRPGTYQGHDQSDSFWKVVRLSSSRWEVYRDGAEVFNCPTLNEAKRFIDYEVSHTAADEAEAQR